jgi:integrase/recombinase XerD
MTDLTDPLSLAYLEHRASRDPENTIKARRRVLKSLGNAGTADREQVERWWETRQNRAPATCNQELALLRTFYKWCQTWEHRADDPTLRLEGRKQGSRVPRPIGRAELATLLEQLDGDLRRAVCLGAYAGLRVSEAAALSWIDVDIETRRIRVIGKGDKERMVGLSPLLLDELLPVTGGNVVTAGEKPYSAAVLQRKVNRAIKAAGVDATFHKLRHRFGTIALDATGNLLAVARAMGHANVATTAGYAATSDADLDVIAAAVTK